MNLPPVIKVDLPLLSKDNELLVPPAPKNLPKTFPIVVYYQKHVAPLKDDVKEVLYHHPFEEYDDFDVDVKRTKFPQKQATVDMFHQLLFQAQLPKPRACLSFLAKVASYLKP